MASVTKGNGTVETVNPYCIHKGTVVSFEAYGIPCTGTVVGMGWGSVEVECWQDGRFYNVPEYNCEVISNED